MLLRTLLRPSRLAPSGTQCLTCHCTCGATFHPQRRPASIHAPAPSTHARTRLQKPKILSPAAIRQQRQADSLTDQAPFLLLDNARQRGLISTPPAAGVAFLNDVHALGEPPSVKAYLAARAQHGVLEQDVVPFALLLLRNGVVRDQARLGRRLLFLASRAGTAEATVRIMNNALKQERSRPGVLRRPEVVAARRHLQLLVRGGGSFRAAVLEGRIAQYLGEEEVAVRLYRQAMEGAVAAAKAARERGAGARERGAEEVMYGDLDELASPWIELGFLHDARTHRGFDEGLLARYAFRIGTEQDDPTAYYYTAEYSKMDWFRHYTADWLHGMTKAAASGHFLAAYQLGMFYATARWKYIKDEAPDALKPTPFDTYPSPKSWLDTAKTLLLPRAHSTSSQDARQHMYHTAAWPPRPQDRIQLALAWLDVACDWTYAPAFVEKARIQLAPQIPAALGTPAAALAQRPSRYTFPSQHAYAAALRTASFDPYADAPTDHPPTATLPNPFHSREGAHKTLLEVVAMASERAARAAILAGPPISSWDAAGKPLQTYDPRDSDLQFIPLANLPPEFMKWTRFPEVRESYAAEVDGPGGVLERVMRVCDEAGLDLKGWDGSVVYRHRGERGEGKG